jgi:hypothetical protein
MRVTVVGQAPGATPKGKVDRPSIYEVLGAENTGASPTGSTFWKSLMGCPREHALGHIAKIRPVYAGDPLTLGWAWHYVLEIYYCERQRLGIAEDASSAAANAAFVPILMLEGHADYRDMGGKLRAMFDTYLDTYESHDKWEILAVEETVQYEGAFNWSARLDLVVRDLDRGGLWVVEHKSARTISTELLDNYQLDLQILGQVWLVEQCIDVRQYDPFRGVVVNVTSTGQKQPQCARVDVLPSRPHLEAFERTGLGLVQIRRQAEKLQWPQYLGHCSGYARGYSRCSYFDLCHDFPQISVAEWADPEIELPPTYTRDAA